LPLRPADAASADGHRRLYKRRHLVENFFQRIKRLRRIGTRYEKLATTFFAMLWLASALCWLL
jgi:transposase